ncbi:MobA/MobL family protein [Bordetella sp. 02P26C-1]|uniref:MobA/MobL family protein n=1 Tax=Bordetella sp. 02P26C-1 TaxID=2683195 RepID=UPI0013534EAB|nr:MobA/MobL family protein [Bordetella sp. 02P26C-1]MVW80113.1 hypothetical protein [Bordetella sp. 02P26C-1]
MSRPSDSARNGASLAITYVASRVRAEANRAGREADQKTRAIGRGQNKNRGRIPMAPPSSSKYHAYTNFSNRAGSRKSPKSAINKVNYDYELKRKETEISRLDYVYVSAPDGTPTNALDPLLMAQACERSLAKRANNNAHIMGHGEISLPHELTKEQRHKLVRDIADAYRDRLGVPIYTATHEPHDGNRNWHVHPSYPLREVLTDGKGGFRLGNKLPDFQRYNQRKDAGLPPRPTFIKDMREVVAALCADALRDAGVDHHLAERWRHGNKTLPAQVDAAMARGDVLFVAENYGRDPTRKEGNSTNLWRTKSKSEQRRAAEQHNRDVQAGTLGPEALTRTLVNRVLTLAKRAGINDPEAIRMLARDHSLSIEWVRAKGGKGAPVTGVRVQMQGGPKVAGKVVGASLPELRRRFNWTDPPTYHRYPSKEGPTFDQYAQAVQTAGLDVTPGQTQDMLSQTVSAGLKRFERLTGKALKNAASAAPMGAALDPATSAAGTSGEAAGLKLPGPLESDTSVSITTSREGDNMVRHLKKSQQQKPNSQTSGETAGTVAIIAGAAAIEGGARAVHFGSKIDPAIGDKASKLVSPMAGIRGIQGLGSGGMKRRNQRHQRRKHRP